MQHASTLFKSLFISLLVILSTIHPTLASTPTGVWTSNGPEGGLVTALAIDPATPTTLYAGTTSGGVFTSQQTTYLYNLPLVLKTP